MIGYMCRTDFSCELGVIGVMVYASEEELREDRKCVKGCGVVRVDVRHVETIDTGSGE